MGGSGSGNWCRIGVKNTADGRKSLNINWLNRHGHLRPGRWSAISWTCRGEPSGFINMQAESDHVILDYKVRSYGEDWEPVKETVNLAWTPCNYGGHRFWFICPGVVGGRYCGRRVGKLYSGGKYFLCRHCHDLAYQSQREDRGGRYLARAQKIRNRLVGSTSMMTDFPDKPKRMHWRTYSRLYQDYLKFDTLSWGALAEKLHLLENALPQHRRKGRRKRA